MKKRIVMCIAVILVLGIGYIYYLQFCRPSHVVTTYKNSSNNSCSYILVVNANKLVLTDQQAENILYRTCIVYAEAAKCSGITIYLYENKYAFLHDEVYCMAKYESGDSVRYNTKEHPEQFHFRVLPAPEW